MLFAVFGLFPLLFNGVVVAAHLATGRPDGQRLGRLRQLVKLLHDEDFWNALVNTFGIFVLSTVPQLLLALMLANLLNRKLRGQTWLRVGVLLPYITPVAASTLVFAAAVRPRHRHRQLASSVVVRHRTTIDWRADKLASWIAIATMVNWRWTGYNALIYLAAMQSVPRDLYEAAALDGAGPWRQLWRITVPMIRPTIIFTVVLSTIGGLQLFTEPMLFDENAERRHRRHRRPVQTIALLIYKTGWKDLNLGYAAAMAWALFR